MWRRRRPRVTDAEERAACHLTLDTALKMVGEVGVEPTRRLRGTSS